MNQVLKLSTIAACLLGLNACGGSNSSADKGAQTDASKTATAAGTGTGAGKATLVYCSEGSPSGFDPAQFNDATTFDASAHTVYNRLVGFEKGATSVVPDLAEKWESSPDGKTYTFHLRPGVKFQSTEYFKPTRDMTADDVLFSFERMLKKDFPFNKAYPAEFPYVVDMGLDTNITKVEKVDDLTVKFTLKDVDAAFVQNIAMPFNVIQSLEYATQLEKAGKASDLNINPIGTGPFILKKYQKDSQIQFVKNPDYWNKDQVKIDNLIFSINKDSSVRAQKVAAGECHLSGNPKSSEIESAKKDGKVEVLQQPGFNLGYIAYNITKGPLAKLEVRQALDMAINKEALLNAVYQGAGQLATNPMPPTQWSYNTNLKNPAYDVEKAKELITKAGVPADYEIALWQLPVSRPYNPNGKLMAEMVQSDWAKIGVKAKIVTYEWAEYQKRGKAGESEAMMIGWTGDNGDPDNWLSPLLGCKAAKTGSNYSRWCQKDFEALLTSARSTTDKAKREADYMKAQEIFKKEVPYSTIAHSVVSVIKDKKVTDFKISPFGSVSFEGVGIN